MTSIHQAQLILARQELEFKDRSIDESWIEQLIGSREVADIREEIERSVAAEVRLRGISLPPLPKVQLDLSAAGSSYWNAVQDYMRKEPKRSSFEPSWAHRRIRKLRLKMAKKVALLPGGLVAFSPALSRRESFIAELQRLAQNYECLPSSEQAKFTRDLAPHLGGLIFPQPIAVAQRERARMLRASASREIAEIRADITWSAWRDGLDRAIAGQRRYKIGGRVGLQK